jgi:transposase-like protein
MDPEAMAQFRYRAVCEVLGSSPIGEVAERYGTTRQSLHTWRKRFEQEGLDGLSDRSRRPRTSPTRLPAAVEAAICEARRQHPRWGARRISHELAQRQDAPAQPTGAMRVQRRVSDNGRIMVTRQRLKLGKRNAGKLVTVIIEDTYFRIIYEGEEIAVKQRRHTGPVSMLRVVSKREDSQKQSSIS